MHSGYTFFFYQYVCCLGIEPTTFCAANAMLYHWATGTHRKYIQFLFRHIQICCHSNNTNLTTLYQYFKLAFEHYCMTKKSVTLPICQSTDRTHWSNGVVERSKCKLCYATIRQQMTALWSKDIQASSDRQYSSPMMLEYPLGAAIIFQGGRCCAQFQIITPLVLVGLGLGVGERLGLGFQREG